MNEMDGWAFFGGDDGGIWPATCTSRTVSTGANAGASAAARMSAAKTRVAADLEAMSVGAGGYVPMTAANLESLLCATAGVTPVPSEVNAATAAAAARIVRARVGETLPGGISGDDGALVSVTSAAATCGARIAASLVTAAAANCGDNGDGAAPAATAIAATSYDVPMAVATELGDAMSVNLFPGEDPFVVVAYQLTVASFALESRGGPSGGRSDLNGAAVASAGRFYFQLDVSPAAAAALPAGAKFGASALVFADGGSKPLPPAAKADTRALGDAVVLAARRVGPGPISSGDASIPIAAAASFVFDGFALPGSLVALGYRPDVRAWDGATWIELTDVANASAIASSASTLSAIHVAGEVASTLGVKVLSPFAEYPWPPPPSPSPPPPPPVPLPPPVAALPTPPSMPPSTTTKPSPPPGLSAPAGPAPPQTVNVGVIVGPVVGVVLAAALVFMYVKRGGKMPQLRLPRNLNMRMPNAPRFTLPTTRSRYDDGPASPDQGTAGPSRGDDDGGGGGGEGGRAGGDIGFDSPRFTPRDEPESLREREQKRYRDLMEDMERARSELTASEMGDEETGRGGRVASGSRAGGSRAAADDDVGYGGEEDPTGEVFEPDPDRPPEPEEDDEYSGRGGSPSLNPFGDDALASPGAAHRRAVQNLSAAALPPPATAADELEGGGGGDPMDDLADFLGPASDTQPTQQHQQQQQQQPQQEQQLDDLPAWQRAEMEEARRIEEEDRARLERERQWTSRVGPSGAFPQAAPAQAAPAPAADVAAASNNPFAQQPHELPPLPPPVADPFAASLATATEVRTEIEATPYVDPFAEFSQLVGSSVHNTFSLNLRFDRGEYALLIGCGR